MTKALFLSATRETEPGIVRLDHLKGIISRDRPVSSIIQSAQCDLAVAVIPHPDEARTHLPIAAWVLIDAYSAGRDDRNHKRAHLVLGDAVVIHPLWRVPRLRGGSALGDI